MITVKYAKRSKSKPYGRIVASGKFGKVEVPVPLGCMDWQPLRDEAAATYAHKYQGFVNPPVYLGELGGAHLYATLRYLQDRIKASGRTPPLA